MQDYVFTFVVDKDKDEGYMRVETVEDMIPIGLPARSRLSRNPPTFETEYGIEIRVLVSGDWQGIRI